MKILLDTHTFIWSDSDPSRLSQTAKAHITDPAVTVLLSVVSVWEIVIKLQLGKLSLSGPLTAVLAAQQANGIALLPVNLDHVLQVESLPAHHKDPLDRLLIAQAIVEGCEVITADPVFAQYPVKVIW